MAALDGGGALRAGARRQFAGGDGGDEEGEERDPVLRIGDGECADRRQEIIIEREGRGDRHEDGLPQAPEGGDPENSEQKSERDGGGLRCSQR